MSSVWERFDNIAKPEDVEQAKASMEPVGEGVYKMRIEQLEAGESKNSGLPMLKARFRILGSNRVFFYNKLLQNLNYQFITDKNIAEVLALLEGMLGEEIEYTKLSDIEDAIPMIPIGSEHIIKVSYGEKDTEKSFPELEVLEEEEEF